MKKYKSNEELLDYIMLKGIIVNNKNDTIDKFQRYTYYSIINTYKEVFKKDGKYINGVTFDEIFSLYEFDKNLKSIFLKYVLEVEIIVKALISNIISEKYGIENYLIVDNFDSKSNVELIKKLILNFNEEQAKNYGRHPAITHYLDKYGFVPPFVLTKIITFGQISRYYGLLKQEDRQKVSKYFGIPDKLLKQILINLTLARNISAHNDKLYTFRSKFLISYKLIDKKFNVIEKSTNFYMLMNCMKLILNSNQYNDFTNQINDEINTLSKKLKSIRIQAILEIMGFPMNK